MHMEAGNIHSKDDAGHKPYQPHEQLLSCLARILQCRYIRVGKQSLMLFAHSVRSKSITETNSTKVCVSRWDGVHDRTQKDRNFSGDSKCLV